MDLVAKSFLALLATAVYSQPHPISLTMKLLVAAIATAIGSAVSDDVSLRGAAVDVDATPFYHLESPAAQQCFETRCARLAPFSVARLAA